MPVGPFSLTTVANVKKYLRIPSADVSEDDLLELLIDAVSERIESFTERKLKERNFVEEYDGTGLGVLTLREFPVSDVSEVNLDFLQDFTLNTIVPLDTIVVSAEEGTIEFIGASPLGATFPRGAKNVRVSYTAGFPDPIPKDLEMAAIKATAADFARSREGAEGVASESIAGRSITWEEGFPVNVTEILRKYRRSI